LEALVSIGSADQVIKSPGDQLHRSQTRRGSNCWRRKWKQGWRYRWSDLRSFQR